MGDFTHISGPVHNDQRTARRHRVRRHVARIGALLLVVLGLVFVTGGAASAHTNAISSTCDNLTVTLTSYNPSSGPNHVKITVDGATKVDQNFGAGFSQVVPVGNRTVSHSWTVAVIAADDADSSQGWSFTRSGTSTPCQPTDVCPYLPGNQPPGTSCTPPPDDHQTRELRDNPDCTNHTITVTEQERTGTYSWNGSAWVLTWRDWVTTGTHTIPTTTEDCPAKTVTPAAPAYTPPSCTSAPHLTYSAGEGYHWVASGPDTARVLDAVAEDGYTLVGQTHYGPYDLTGWTLAEKIQHGCTATPAVPVVHQSPRCGVNGSITPLAGALITYTISGGTWDNLTAGDYVITATLTGGAVEFGDAPGWLVNGITATRTVHIDAPATCVTPSAQVSPQVCVPDEPGAAADGAITVGTEPGVAYVVRDSGGTEVTDTSALPAGDYTVTATALPGYQVVDGNGFVAGVLTLSVLPPSTDCTVEAPVAPEVSAVDKCYTTDDRVDFVADNAYWTAEITDATHVTFTAKDGYYFLDADGATVKQLSLEYPALTDEQCPLVPGDVGATCVGSVPYLAYDLTLPDGFETDDPTPLTITFENPAGADYKVSNLPLSGQMLWPGASDTEPLMWPGWDLVDGEYVNVGNKNYGWTRNGVTVDFDVNPHYETTLTYPPASVKCANPPHTTPPTPGKPPHNPPNNPPNNPPQVFRPPPELPNTGGPSGVLAGLGALLLISGCALVRRAGKPS